MPREAAGSSPRRRSPPPPRLPPGRRALRVRSGPGWRDACQRRALLPRPGPEHAPPGRARENVPGSRPPGRAGRPSASDRETQASPCMERSPETAPSPAAVVTNRVMVSLLRSGLRPLPWPLPGHRRPYFLTAGCHIEESCRPGLSYDEVDGSRPGSVHAKRGPEIRSALHDREILPHTRELGLGAGGLDGWS